MNKAIIFIFVFITLMSAVHATEIQINTTITLDWIGGDEFYIRTEGGDHLYSSMNQTDSVINLTFTKEVDLTVVNASMETKLLLDAFKNVTEAVNELNATKKWVETKAAHERVVVYYEDCKEERDIFASERDNETILRERAEAISESLDVQLTTYKVKNANCTATLTEIESSGTNKFWTGFFVAALIAGGLYLFSEEQKKKSPHKVMKDSGHPGFGRRDK